MIGANGGLADYLIVESANARRIPEHMSLELAGMMAPLRGNQ